MHSLTLSQPIFCPEIASAACIQVHFRLDFTMEVNAMKPNVNAMKPNQTALKGAV